MLRHSATPMAVLLVAVLLGCTSPGTSTPSDPTNDGAPVVSADPGPADGQARALALDAAHSTLAAIGIDPATVEGSSRVRSCTDGLGSRTDQHYGEYSSGGELGAGTLTDEQISSLVDVLGIEFLEDSVDDDGVRMVSFALPVGPVGEVSVIVTVSRVEDGAATLTTVTPCVG